MALRALSDVEVPGATECADQSHGTPILRGPDLSYLRRLRNSLRLGVQQLELADEPVAIAGVRKGRDVDVLDRLEAPDYYSLAVTALESRWRRTRASRAPPRAVPMR
jgi:hypothetical protein